MHAHLGWLAFWSIGPVAAALSGGTPVVLTPGVPVERIVSGGDAHEYTIALARRDVLHAIVDQRGVDMVEELYDPAGHLVLRIDSARGAYGPEPIWLVAERNGHYRIRVTSLFATARGSYTIRVEERRTSTPRDERRAEAARLSARARNFEELTTSRERAESQQALVRSARMWGETGDAREEALALLDVGRAFQHRAENRGSLPFFRESEERAAAAGDPQLQAKVLSSEGFAFSWLGDPTASYEAFARSALLARAAGDPQQESAALHGQALSRWHTGAFQEALELDRKSLAIARSIHDPEQEAWALWGLGLTDVMIGELERSVEESSESLALWRELRESYGESSTLQNLGYAYWLMGREARALEVYRQALAAARALGDLGGEALALTNIGLAETDLAPDSAARSLEEAVGLWRRIGSRHGEALALRNLGQALERLGRMPEARARSSESVAAARAGGDRPGEAYALDGLAALEARDGDLDAARGHIEASLAILESLRGGLAAAPLQSSFLSTKQDYYGTALEIFLRLDEREPGRGYASEAFRALERGRARALAEAIAVARLDLDPTHELPTDVARREKDLGAEIDRLQKELAGASDHAAAEKRLRMAEEEWDTLLAEMRRTAPRYAALRYPDAMSYEEARSLVDSEAALVSYSLQIDPPAAFVLTATGLAVHRLPVSAADLRERVENYVGLLAKDDTDRWGALSSELYRELIAPWRDALPVSVRRLVIVPDGVLHSLPFEALARPGSPRRVLLEDFAVSYAPSATVLGELSVSRSAVRAEAAADLLVVAAPAVGKLPRADQELEGETFDLSPLPHAAAEARSIGRFGGPASEIDVGENASESRIKGRSLERFGVLHFATHALLSRRVPSRSALLLASDGGQAGLLTAREIHRLRLRSDLVVLSACRTAQGRILAGDGVQSLARAFFHAGAHSLVASLWDVADRRTAGLMTTFYRRLAAGSTKAAALREAKLELLRENPNLAPRFWAPFVLIGEPNARVPLREPRPDWRLAGAAALVVGATWALIRRQRRARSKGKGPSFSVPAAVSTSTVQK